MGFSELLFCVAALLIAKFRMALAIDALRTVAFVAIVFGNQATTYMNREREKSGAARPSVWVVASSGGDLLIASVLALCGIAMTPLPGSLIGEMLLAAVVFAVLLDVVKVPVFRRLIAGE